MKKQRNALKAGLFIVACIILIIVILIGIKGVGNLFEPVQIHTASFPLEDNIGGLRVGDDVRIGGFRVGTVRAIDVADAGPHASIPPRIVIHYSIPKKFVVREDAKLTIETTVTGSSVLNFVTLGKGTPMTSGQTLVGQPGTLQTILSTLSAAAPQLNDILTEVHQSTLPKVNQTVDKYAAAADSFHAAGENAAQLIADLRQKADPVIAHYHQVADSANTMLDTINDLLGGNLKGDLQGVFANLNSATADIRKRLPDILDQADRLITQLNTTVDGINSSLTDVKHAFVNARQFTGSARDILISNTTRIDDMIAALKKTSDNLQFASEEIRRSPWRLLYKPKPDEMANLNIFDSARQFAQGAQAMADSAGALRDALSLPHPDQKQIQTLMQQLDASFSNFQSVEKKLWQAVKE